MIAVSGVIKRDEDEYFSATRFVDVLPSYRARLRYRGGIKTVDRLGKPSKKFSSPFLKKPPPRFPVKRRFTRVADLFCCPGSNHDNFVVEIANLPFAEGLPFGYSVLDYLNAPRNINIPIYSTGARFEIMSSPSPKENSLEEGNSVGVTDFSVGPDKRTRVSKHGDSCKSHPLSCL